MARRPEGLHLARSRKTAPTRHANQGELTRRRIGTRSSSTISIWQIEASGTSPSAEITRTLRCRYERATPQEFGDPLSVQAAHQTGGGAIALRGLQRIHFAPPFNLAGVDIPGVVTPDISFMTAWSEGVFLEDVRRAVARVQELTAADRTTWRA